MPQFDVNSYVTVQERITQFWEKYPAGAILVDLLTDPNKFDQVVFRASVYKDRSDSVLPDAVGHAAEWKGGGMTQATSWHETGESSAIGRALANLGFATSNSDRPSREEMEKVQRHENEGPAPIPYAPPPTPFRQPQYQAPPQQQYQQGYQQQAPQQFNGQGQGQQIRDPNAPASEKQKNLISVKWRERFPESGEGGKHNWVANHLHTTWEQLTKGQASTFIEAFNDPGMAPF